MEDLKQIQEFFSKPLNENKVTKEDFDKVVKILSKSKYPFTIMLVPKWDEIDIITGQDSPDEIVDDIGQRLDSAGLNWGGNSGITISGDSSNYSRREYSDIFRVNGGHKDYYEESVNEVTRYGGFTRNPEDPDSEPFNPTGSVAEFREDLRALFGKFKGDLKNPEFIKGVAEIMVNWKSLLRNQLEEDKKLTYSDFVDMVRADMRAGAANDENTSENQIERVARWKYDDYLKGTSIDDLFLYEVKEIDEADLNDPVAMKMRAAKMKADKLAKMRAANAGDDGNDKFFDAAKLRALKKKRAQIMRDMEQEAEMEGGPIADKYGDMLNKIDKAISMLNEATKKEYNALLDKEHELTKAYSKDKTDANWKKLSDIRKKGKKLEKELEDQGLLEASKSVGLNEYDVYMPSQEEVDQFFAKTNLETHYLNSKPVMGQEGTFNLMPIEPWDEYDYSNWMALVRKAKAKGKAIAENDSYARVSKPRFIKDKNNPNFLNVILDYDIGPGGNPTAFGKETMTGQIRRLSSAKARKVAHDIALDLEANFNLEDIEVTDLENGKVRIFAVSDDFIDMDPNMLSEGASTEEKRMAMQAIKRFAKYRGVSEKEAKADLLRAIKELGSIEEAINEIVETIQAGKVLEEKLCKKGEAYRKRRIAAGEKSSAYLSGRAVKVCKGQMSGKKKKK